MPAALARQRRRFHGSVLPSGLTLPWFRERGKRQKPRYAMQVCRAGRRRFFLGLPFASLTAFPSSRRFAGHNG